MHRAGRSTGSELTVRENDPERSWCSGTSPLANSHRTTPDRRPSVCEQQMVSGTPIRLLYGPSAALGKLWLGVEVRTDNDTFNRYGSAVSASWERVSGLLQSGAFSATSSTSTERCRATPPRPPFGTRPAADRVPLKLYRLGSSGYQRVRRLRVHRASPGR